MSRLTRARSGARPQTVTFHVRSEQQKGPRPLQRFVSQHGSERWATLCFCLLFLSVFCLLRGAFISTPPCAWRQHSALLLLDLWRAASASPPPERKWD